MSAPWPEPHHEQLLRALLSADAPEPAGDIPLDRATRQLLPLAYWRWPSSASPLVQEGRRAHLTAWQQNKQRFELLASLVAHLKTSGIPSLVLKGAALTQAHYLDPGLRPMRDVDLMVPLDHAPAAARKLVELGFTPENGAFPNRFRVGHGWQFFQAGQSLDLHWRPLVRCFSPEITKLFWEGATSDGVPCPTDQLFHVCAHGLQWDWEPSVRWIADAWFVMRNASIDWDRLYRLAELSNMRCRLFHALHYLREKFGIMIPDETLARLAANVPSWETSEYHLLLKPCPLNAADSLRWHQYHFRRIRPFDQQWSSQPYPLAFSAYLAEFLEAEGQGDFMRRLWSAVTPRFSSSS